MARPVLPTPVFPTKTMFSARGTKSRPANPRIWRRFTPGCFLKGKVSMVHGKGSLARLIRHCRAPSWRACHWALRRRRRNSS
jgi:hypothetical protein